MVHVPHDLVLLHHHRDSLRFVDTSVFLVVLGILLQRRLQVLSDTDVVHDQSCWLVAEHAVHTRNRLHQSVTLHRLVNVHRVHTRRVKAGQPHISHDHQLKRVFGIAGALGEQIAPSLVADVLLPFLRVARCASHHDLDRSRVVIGAVPVRAKLDNLII